VDNKERNIKTNSNSLHKLRFFSKYPKNKIMYIYYSRLVLKSLIEWYIIYFKIIILIIEF